MDWRKGQFPEKVELLWAGRTFRKSVHFYRVALLRPKKSSCGWLHSSFPKCRFPWAPSICWDVSSLEPQSLRIEMIITSIYSVLIKDQAMHMTFSAAVLYILTRLLWNSTIISILWMRKLNFREMKKLPQSHIARKWQSWGWRHVCLSNAEGVLALQSPIRGDPK